MGTISRRQTLTGIAAVGASSLSSGCLWINEGEVGNGKLEGRVFVEWVGEDRFAYWKNPGTLRFRPSFMTTAIVPDDMYTDGGSVPRALWGIPGLSPWALGPAYIIHDWIFEVHRCNRAAPPEVKNITFEQSALILAEVAKALVDATLVRGDLLDAIIWAIRTDYARSLWDRPGDDCVIPTRRARARARVVADFVIPPARRIVGPSRPR